MYDLFTEERVYHTLFGSMPDEGVWTMRTTPLESLEQFDKELQIRLDKEKQIVGLVEEPVRQEIHKDVFRKIDKLMGWGDDLQLLRTN